ncbi:hypothetical protein P7M03_16430 [Vibrio parahaemolyticus]|uniref:hypothetical protein n=1 Tax=Vibrio diabolicus TaxID=50719 RepID=UPI001D6F1F1D|nr:hypothetical protein [Vibrio diabolicus]EGR0771658.1 hypothetical protein [Vibrio parahaemolyticus]EGR0841278.1 hypothetical protein [Vibrio parahaemolyticus]EGR2696584.1 hypothetical protein [Vibrio parahaemolyticus]MDG2651984.1 hypothetical protein [Vibrio parahaemolyticus]
MNMPTPEQIKLESGLPNHANFHGWLIHNPEQDDFLLKASEHRGALAFSWCPSPESAKRYNRFARALKAIKHFELEDRAVIVASFDVGRQIVVIAPEAFKERFSVDSANPFRTNELI